MVLDTGDQKSRGYKSKVKTVKHNFRNTRSCNEDIEVLTKTLLEDKENDVR